MINTSQTTLLWVTEQKAVHKEVINALQNAGYRLNITSNKQQAINLIESNNFDLVLIDESLTTCDFATLSLDILKRLPAVPLICIFDQDDPDNYKTTLSIGASDCICLPFSVKEFLQSIELSLQNAASKKEWLLLNEKKITKNLKQRLTELEILSQLGRSITSQLDLDLVFRSIVESAVRLTHAEEGSLMLLDEEGQLTIRAEKNFNEDFVQTFRLKVEDTLAGNVIKQNHPVLLNETIPQKIATTYHVHQLIYVPIQLEGNVLGVLGVDNRTQQKPFSQTDVQLLSTLAEFAAVAIVNASLYEQSHAEQTKLSTLLEHIQDYVILMDQQNRLLAVNQSARKLFKVPDNGWQQRSFFDVFDFPDITRLVLTAGKGNLNWEEISFEDGRVLTAQVVPVPEVGFALTMHDITNLKNLDKIKNDFVNAVSHDLRSPLTAIMGYVELIERVGPVNETQKDFIQKVILSANSITNLVDDLLNLGRIEASLSPPREVISITTMLREIVETFQDQIKKKSLHLVLEIPEEDIQTLGDPVQIRQVGINLFENAIKYTPENGLLQLICYSKNQQAIFQVSDSGIGIPQSEQVKIFEKFFRASNVDDSTLGTGLGLSIVKTIIDRHNGRIWLDSKEGKGTTFTVMLPLAENN